MQRLWAIRNSHGPSARRFVERVQLAVGLEQRLLHDVFAVQHRAGHPRAVPVQARPELRHRFQERLVAGVEEARRVEVGIRGHVTNTQPEAEKIRRHPPRNRADKDKTCTDRTTIRRRNWIPLIALAALAGTAAPVAAQGIGVGMRLAWVKREVPFEADWVRFIGGQLRLVGGRIGVEVAVDRHSEKFEALNQKVVEMPIQTSVLLRLANGKVAPFLLGGPGWYRRRVEPIDGPDLSVKHDRVRLACAAAGWRSTRGGTSASTATTATRSSISTTTTTRKS